MTLVLEMKEKCKQIYANFGYAILPVLKFALAMAIFYSINTTLKFSDKADNIFLLLIMALICCVLPLGITVFCGLGLIVFQCYSVGIEVAGFALALILLLFIFYVRFTPDDAIVLLLTPLAFMLKIPCAIPIAYGLTKRPASAVSTGCGVIMYYFIMLVQHKASILQATTGEEEMNISKNLQILIDSMLNNTDLLINLVAFIAVMLTVYLIRRLSVDYAWQIAIFSGAVMYIIIWVMAGMLMDVECLYLPLILGTIGSIAVAEILAFFRFGVDYSRTEYHQFEDDDYYYYVKAVPKIKITEKKVTVQKIHEKEPEVVVEETKVYRPKSKSVSGTTGTMPTVPSASGNTAKTVSRTTGTIPVVTSDTTGMKSETKPMSAAAEKTEQKPAVSGDTMAFTPVKREMLAEEKMSEAKVAKDEMDEELDDADFQKKLEESLKNL